MTKDLSKVNGTLRRISSSKSDNELWSRFIFGLGKIKDVIYTGDKAREYDDSLAPVLQNLLETKYCKEMVISLINKHNKDIAEEKDGVIHDFQLDINNPIDKELNIYFKDVFIRGAMSIDCLMRHTRYMGYSIKFLFSDEESKFKKGLKKFPLLENEEKFVMLKDFIQKHKNNWYTEFREMRRKIEHIGFKLPQVEYDFTTGVIIPIYPSFQEQSMTEHLEIVWNNLFALCEDIIAYILDLKLPDPYVIVSIPVAKRDPSLPVKYGLGFNI